MDQAPNKILQNVPSPHSLKNRIVRGLWNLVWLLMFRPSPKFMHGWRRFLLRLFGARIGRGSVVHSSARIWLPANLEMGDDSCIANDVDCYNVAKIFIGSNSTVTQYSYLCTTSHDITKSSMPLITAPIVIEDQVWVTASVFVGMGVTIGQGAVVGACAVVTKDVPPWMIVAGNPAKVIKQRVVDHDDR